jgi:hypothetical protein
MLYDHDLNLGRVHDGRHPVAREVVSPDSPLLKDELLRQGVANPHYDATLHLTDDAQRIERSSNIGRGQNMQNPCRADPHVDLDFDRLLEVLDFKTYSVAEVAHLVHIHPRRASRWPQGYSYEYEAETGRCKYAQQAPVVRREGTLGTIYASFLDLIDFLFVIQFLDHGISL